MTVIDFNTTPQGTKSENHRYIRCYQRRRQRRRNMCVSAGVRLPGVVDRGASKTPDVFLELSMYLQRAYFHQHSPDHSSGALLTSTPRKALSKLSMLGEFPLARESCAASLASCAAFSSEPIPAAMPAVTQGVGDSRAAGFETGNPTLARTSTPSTPPPLQAISAFSERHPTMF